jgi:hypothetical protein
MRNMKKYQGITSGINFQEVSKLSKGIKRCQVIARGINSIERYQEVSGDIKRY